MAQAKVAVRLGTEGKEDVVRDFKAVGDAGDAAANRAAKSFERAAQDMESAQRRQAAAAQKIVALMPADQRQKAGIMAEPANMPSKAMFVENQRQMALYEQQAQALRLALDPVAMAQQRFNVEMGAARTLISNGKITLDEYVGKLRMEQAALDQSVAAHKWVGESSGAMRSGMQQAGFQMQDFLVQVQGGTSATRAFSQQAPQLIGSLQMMTHGAEGGSGRFAKFASIIGGSWGVALGVAIPLAGIFAEKLFNDEKASKAAQKAAEDHKSAIEALTKAMDASVQTASDKARADFIALETERQDTLAIREKTAALLEQAQARLKLVESTPGNATNNSEWAATVAAAQADAVKLQDQIKANQDAIDRLTRTAGIAQGNYVARILDDLRTPEGRVNSRFTRQRNAIIESERDPTRQANAIARLEASRDAELKKIQETDKALRGSTAALTQFLMPVNGTITSGFGARNAPKAGASTNHQAIDIAVPTGTAIKAPAVGVVEAIGYSESLGKFVVINHGGGTKTRYGHLSDNSIVAKGEAVQQGEMIGRAGSTGRSTGPHLHYQVMVNGKPVDPRKGLFPTDGAGVEMTAATRDTTMLDATRKAFELEKERNGWINEQAANAGKSAIEALTKEGELIAENRGMMAQMRYDTSAGTALLNIEWQLRAKGRDEVEATLELERYRLDIVRQFPAATAAQVAELVTAKQSQIEMNRLLQDYARDWQEMQQFGEGFIDTVLSPGTWSSWGAAGKTILAELQNEMMKLAVINPLKNMLFGGGLPTLGSVLSIFGGASTASLAGSVAANNFVGPRAAIGHDYTPAGAMLVGENGPEIVDMPRGARVLTASDSRRAMGSQAAHVTFEVRGLKGSTFDVEVAQISDGRVAMAAPAIAMGASNGAQRAMVRRGGRRLA